MSEKLAVFMTVGTGTEKNKEKGMESQAHGIAYFIKEMKPDKIVFFVSKESEETIEYVKKYTEINETNSEIVLITNINDITEIATKIFHKVSEYEKMGFEIKMNYTFGTKTMTTALSFISVLKKKDLYLVGGRRGENGIIIPGTEELKKQSLHVIYDVFLFEKVKEMFNSYKFSNALNFLNNIVVFEDVEKERTKKDYENLIKGCREWDKFNHKDAVSFLKHTCLIPSSQLTILKRLVFLAEKNDKTKSELEEYYAMLLADLINNSKRRINEHKYDDAVARLYRVIEFIAQMKLKVYYDVDTSNVNLILIPREHCEKYEKLRDERGKIRLGLKKAYELLKDFGNETGKNFFNNKEMEKLLFIRNNSILAHGFVPINKENAEKFFEIVKDFAIKEVKQTNNLIEEIKFITL